MHVNERGVLEKSQMYYHTPSNIAQSLFFYLKYAGEFFCDETYTVERETFNSFLIMYVRKGQGFISYEGKNYSVKENDVVLLNCHKPHVYYTTKGWETLWIHFDGNLSREFFDMLYSRMGCVIPQSKSLIILRYLTLIIDGFKISKPLPEPIVSCYIQRMLTEIMLISANSPEKNTSKDSYVLDAITYIEANFKEKLTLKNISSSVCISPFHFSRTFKKETGYSPYEYIIKTRINYAKDMLKKTRCSIKEIAFEVGFNSESNFVHTFHTATDMTPNEFRNTPF